MAHRADLVAAGLQGLEDAGLAMQAVFDLGELPVWATDPLREAGIDIARYQRLVMLGQAGTRFWDNVVARASKAPDPFDEASIALAGEFVRRYLADAAWAVAYPGPALLPLGRLAEMAGWGRPSPLGLTINSTYGLWIAHRVAFVVDAPVAPRQRAATAHPCDTCADKPCVTACPVGAVDAVAGFDVSTCAIHRIRDNSDCALQCLARNACPVGSKHRYGPSQMEHHYAAGLASIRSSLADE